jgi:hypothetical protein
MHPKSEAVILPGWIDFYEVVEQEIYCERRVFDASANHDVAGLIPKTLTFTMWK